MSYAVMNEKKCEEDVQATATGLILISLSNLLICMRVEFSVGVIDR